MMRGKREKPAGDINTLFRYKVCINLDRRPDRWKKMEAGFAHHGITSVVRHPALDGLKVSIPSTWSYTPGAYGCLQSHLEVLRVAREKGWPNILIFEDDCVFDQEFNQKFADYIEQVPGDWDMLLLGGGHHEKPDQVSDNLVKSRGTYFLHAYALDQGIFDALIELCEQGQRVVDQYTVDLQKTRNCYCFVPNLVWQERIDSDIRSDVSGRGGRPLVQA
jgi:glycosyl transferase family 25